MGLLRFEKEWLAMVLIWKALNDILSQTLESFYP